MKIHQATLALFAACAFSSGYSAGPIVGTDLLIGTGATNAGIGANAIGVNASAIGNHSLAFGYQASAEGNQSLALGYRARVIDSPTRDSTGSIALGYQAQTYDHFSSAIGLNAATFGGSSHAKGNNALALGAGSFAFGAGSGDYYHEAWAGAMTSTLPGPSYTPADFAGLTKTNTVNGGTIRQTIAGGSHSFAFGYGAKTDTAAHHSFAFGPWAWTGNQNAFALGNRAYAPNAWSYAIGGYAQAEGNAATALGYKAQALRHHSTAIGTNAAADGEYSVAIGYGSETVGRHSTAIGWGSLSNTLREVVVGTFNEQSSGSYNAWVETDPIFTVGNGTSTAPSNALRVLKNGETHFAGPVYVEPAGDISMGSFTAGVTPSAAPTTDRP